MTDLNLVASALAISSGTRAAESHDDELRGIAGQLRELLAPYFPHGLPDVGSDVGAWLGLLTGVFGETGMIAEPIVNAARRLLMLSGTTGTSESAPLVALTSPKGVVIGQGNTQNNIWALFAFNGRTHLPLGLLLVALLGVAVATGSVVVGATFLACAAGWSFGLYWRRSIGQSERMPEYPQGASARRDHLIREIDRWWVEGALRRSLQAVLRVEIGFVDQPDAVFDRWGSRNLENLPDGDPLPPGTRLRDLWQRHLLVVGDQGSGKTTHLLEFADDLLAQARRDESAPVPLVLLLSTWKKSKKGLADWVRSEAQQRYSAEPLDILARMEQGQLVLLLDGLDELRDERVRLACLEDIDTFMTDPRFTACGLVVTCRTDDFNRLNRRIVVERAVRVMKLSNEQVAAALISGGQRLTALRELVRVDPALAELLTTPLMLGVAVLAFDGLPEGGSPLPGDATTYKSLLFGMYVRRMLDRSRALRGSVTKPGPYSSTEVFYYLVWLARLMDRGSQTIFYTDLLTPAFLPDRNPAWPLTRQRGLVALIARLLGWDHASTGLVGAGLGALVGALAGAPLGAVAGGLQGALIGVVTGAVVMATAIGLTFGVLLQLPGAEIALRPIIGHDTFAIYAASSWSWSWRSAVRVLLGVAAVSVTVGGALILAGLPPVSMSVVIATLGLAGVLSGGSVPDHSKPPVAPGAAMGASMQRLTRLVVILVLAVLVGAVGLALTGNRWDVPIAVLPVTVALMMTAGPGRAWLRHRAAYFGARRSHLLPEQLDQLMYQGDDRVLLSRVGGGYMFLHRDLQEYLAKQEPERLPTIA